MSVDPLITMKLPRSIRDAYKVMAAHEKRPMMEIMFEVLKQHQKRYERLRGRPLAEDTPLMADDEDEG